MAPVRTLLVEVKNCRHFLGACLPRLRETSLDAEGRPHAIVALRRAWTDFARQAGGSIAPIFGVLLIPITLATGAAVDYSRASYFKTALQTALDAGLLAGAKDGSSSWSNVALAAFNANIGTQAGSVSAPSFTQVSADIYTGTVVGKIPTVVLGIIHVPSVDVAARATAKAAAPDNACLLTLDHGQSLSHVSLSLNGAPVVNMAGCSVRSNTSIDCNGHDGNVVKAIAAGTAGDCVHPKSNAPTVPDVYAGLASNITTACGSLRPGVTWNPGVLPVGPGIITVNKGSYTEYHICGNLTLSGTGYLTGSAPSSDSVIVIENGDLIIPDKSSISTARTAIVMTGNNNFSSKIDFPTGNGQSATLNLSAPTSAGNPWQGVALYLDPKLTKLVDNRWGPGATLNADGLMYLGTSNIVTDGVTGSGNAKCSKFVMNSFVTNGAVDLNLNQSAGACNALGLMQWGGVIVHLTK